MKDIRYKYKIFKIKKKTLMQQQIAAPTANVQQ